MKPHSPVVFDGPFALLCPQFIQHKQSLGYVYGLRAEYAVKNLDDFFKAFAVSSPRLTRTMVEAYIAKRRNEAGQTQQHRISLVREFARFLQTLGYEASVLPRPPYTGTKTFAPYIFTRDEIATLMQAADQLPYQSQYPQSHLVYPMLLRILYGCGLRISEALALTMATVDLDHGMLRVIHGKFHHSRFVPMSPSLTQWCVTYRNRMQFSPDYTGYFFPAPDGTGAYAPVSVYGRFRRLLEQGNIPHGGRGHGPRLYDLRYPNLNKIPTFSAKRCDSNFSTRKGWDFFLHGMLYFLNPKEASRTRRCSISNPFVPGGIMH